MSFFNEKYKDLALDSDGDLAIKDGDFYLVESDQQHIEHIVESAKGNWLESPVVGVGIVQYLNTSEIGSLRRKIRLQLEFDNYKVNAINLKAQNGIEIDAKRTK